MISGGSDPHVKQPFRFPAILCALSLLATAFLEYRLFGEIAGLIVVLGAAGFGLVLHLMRGRPWPVQQAPDSHPMGQALASTTVSKDFLSRMVANWVDPLFVMGPDTVIRVINPAASKVLGYSEAELVGRPLSLLCPGEEDRLIKSELGNRLRQGIIRNLEMSMVAKNGEKVPVLFSSAVIKEADEEAATIIAVAKDMTERKKMEKQLLQTSKMSAIGQLAGGVAHEINNPLTVILGFAQGLVRRVKPGDPFEAPLQSIEREARRCKNLVQDLLAFSRVSRSEREPMDLNQAIEGALSLVMAQARMGQIEVKKELAANLPRLLGNPNQIQQIIINLANNALDAMGNQGTLTIRTDVQRTPPRSWVCLSIADTGCGIPSEEIPRIFEPFYTTKPPGKGTGLGLGLVHEIVQKHSGMIEVKSRSGQTQFHVKFPICALSDKEPPPNPPAA